MTTTPSPHLSLARRREMAWRAARAYASRVKQKAAGGIRSERSAREAELDAVERYRGFISALELASVTSPAAARAAGLTVWVDPVLGFGVEVDAFAEIVAKQARDEE